MRRVLFCLSVVVPGLACDKEKTDEFLVDLGLGGAVNERPPGIYAAVPRGDLEEMAKVGRWLDLGARALELANATVVERMGTVDADVVLPLVDIDPEGTSGQVVFIRWPGGKAAGAELKVEDAQRWVLVAMMFGPDRVIDLELLQGEVPRGSIEERRINALLVSAAELQRRVPKAAFFTVDRFQAEPTGDKRKPQRTAVVVYALAQDDAGPDFEIAADEPRKPKRDKRPEKPALVRTIEVHPKGGIAADPVVVDLPDPHPLTVARAVRSGRVLHVRAQSGTYEIAADGTVVRMTPAP